MFDQFSQNDNSVLFKDAHELGLGECKELIVKMGGDLWAESKEGKGSIFKFNIKSSIPQATVLS
jgi:signal transduction histidine kinase